MIPGITDDRANLEGLGAIARANGVHRIDLLPYHTAGIAKYAKLGRSYTLAEVAAPSPDGLDPARRYLEALGLSVHIGG